MHFGKSMIQQEKNFINNMISHEVYCDIVKHLEKARKKHPIWLPDPCLCLTVAIAAEEFGEWAKEMNDNNVEGSREECLDLIAVLIRYLEGK